MQQSGFRAAYVTTSISLPLATSLNTVSISTSRSPKNVWRKSVVPFSKPTVPATKRFPRNRFRRDELREPGVAESICRGRLTTATAFISAGNRERAGYLSAMKRWYFAFLTCGIVAFTGCASDEEFNAAEAAKARGAVPGEVNPNAPDASQQQVRSQPGLNF
jgi:hypothetical protein